MSNRLSETVLNTKEPDRNYEVRTLSYTVSQFQNKSLKQIIISDTN